MRLLGAGRLRLVEACTARDPVLRLPDVNLQPLVKYFVAEIHIHPDVKVVLPSYPPDVAVLRHVARACILLGEHFGGGRRQYCAPPSPSWSPNDPDTVPNIEMVVVEGKGKGEREGESESTHRMKDSY